MIYLKYDPYKGTPIPDGYAEEYASDIAAVVEKDENGIFTVGNELVLTYIRALIKEQAIDPLKLVFQLPGVADQHADHKGKLKHWHRRDLHMDALSRLI